MAIEINFDARRRAVLALRLRRMSEVEIATALGIHQSTVSRDLDWIREHWAEELGEQAHLDAAQEIGEAIALYADMEGEALAEYHFLATVPGSARSRARMDCLRTASDMRTKRVNLLQDLGFLDRRIGRVDVTHTIRADEVREILKKEGLLGLTVVGASSTEAAEPSSKLMRWLHPSERDGRGGA